MTILLPERTYLSKASFSIIGGYVSNFELQRSDGVKFQHCGTDATELYHTFESPAEYEIVGFFGYFDKTAIQSIGTYVRQISARV